MRVRRSSKVILVDEHRRVLLFRGGDPHRPEAGTWWYCPGGGQEEGETVEECARREVFEETGCVLGELGPVVFRRQAEFVFMGEPIAGDETYFVTQVPAFEPSTAGWTELERQVMEEHRWWTLDELRSASERVYPLELLALVERHA